MKENGVKDQFIEMRAKGLSYQRIAEELSISKQTAINWAKELRIAIHNCRALEMEALYEKHLLTTRYAVEFFGEQLQRIKAELVKRSLEDVPTEKLFDLLVKLSPLPSRGTDPLVLKEKVAIVDRDFMNEEKACEVA